LRQPTNQKSEIRNQKFVSSDSESALEFSASPHTEVSARAYWRLLRGNPNFRRLWAAQIVSELGDWFYVIAIYTLLLNFTGRAQSLGLALVLQVLPQTFVGPSAGVVNDRIRRKHVMIAADIVRAAVVLSMMLVRTPQMVWLAYPLLVLETVMAAFFEPARNSVIPNIVRREEIIVGNTLSSVTWSFDLAVGATLGGVVLAFSGRDAVFVVNALSFVASALLISRMKFDEPHAQGRPLRARDVVDYSPMIEGIRYMQAKPRLLATVFVKFGLGLFIGATWVTYALMGERMFAVHIGPPGSSGVLGMSLLIGARGLGALIGPLIAANWAGQRDERLRRGILLGFCAAAAGVASLSIAPNVWIAVLCVVVAHCGGSVIWTFSTTMLQLNSDDQFRGRVFSADLGLCMAAIALTAYVASAMVDAGVPLRTLAAYTGGFLVIPALWWLAIQRLWRED
jgi:predicted MFS family arabinose efflux permease